MPKKKPDLSSYRLWLIGRKYQPSTVQASLRHMRALYRRDWTLPKPVPSHLKPQVRRYLRYVDESGRNPMGAKFLEAVRGQGLEAAADIRFQGPREKTLLGSTQWTKLRSKLRRGDDASRLLVAYMQSPYRIGDFLKLRADQVTEEDVADKISRDWIVKEGGRRKLYRLVCKTERCTYYRMRRRLQEVCERLEYEADFDSLYKAFHERQKEKEGK